LKDVSVEFVDEPFDGIRFRVFHEECLVSVKVFSILDERLVAFLREDGVRRENKTRLSPNNQSQTRVKRGELRTIIPAAAMALGVMLVSSIRVARGRGPERRVRPDFPTDVGPRRMARRIF
jgi:hypothetical protein